MKSDPDTVFAVGFGAILGYWLLKRWLDWMSGKPRGMGLEILVSLVLIVVVLFEWFGPGVLNEMVRDATTPPTTYIYEP